MFDSEPRKNSVTCNNLMSLIYHVNKLILPDVLCQNGKMRDAEEREQNVEDKRLVLKMG
jgi:hypothetical protein